MRSRAALAVGVGAHRMGCGGSKKSQPSEHKQLNQQLVTSISNNHTDDDTGETSDDHHTDIMLRKGIAPKQFVMREFSCRVIVTLAPSSEN